MNNQYETICKIVGHLFLSHELEMVQLKEHLALLTENKSQLESELRTLRNGLRTETIISDKGGVGNDKVPQEPSAL